MRENKGRKKNVKRYLITRQKERKRREEISHKRKGEKHVKGDYGNETKKEEKNK